MTSPNSSRTFTLSFLGLFLATIAILGLATWSPLLQQLADVVPENLRQAIAQLQLQFSPQPPDGLGEETPVWQWLAIAFSTVFVAEMGDKTQLATMLMSAQGKSPWSIFFGSASALVAASLVSVTLGCGLSATVPPELLQAIAGISFIGLGMYVLWAELTGVDDNSSVEDCVEGSDGL